MALLTYSPALDGKFLWDDDAHVTAPSLRSVTGLWKIWANPQATQQYYPLTHSAFWLAHRLWGENTVGYHIANVVLHVGSAVLLWRILILLAVPGAWLAAAIFALHPVHVESVAWISELKNTLSGVFYLAALLAYLRFDPPGVPAPAEGPSVAPKHARAWRDYGVALGLFICALLSKTVTASLPAAILLVMWWKEGRVGWRRHVVPLIPFFLIGITLGLNTAWVERHTVGAEGEAFAFTWADRVLIAGRALWFYVSKLVWPVNLTFIYPQWAIDRSAWRQYLYPWTAVAVVALLAAMRKRLGRAPIAAALFFAGTLVPALGFFNVYPFLYSFVADHFQYLASLGIITLGAALIASGLRRLGLWQKPVGYAVCAGLLLILAALSWRQARLYTDPPTLYRGIIARNPGAGMAYVNLGVFYAQQGRHAEAIEVLRTLLAIRPDHPTVHSTLAIAYAHYELGLAYAARGRLEEAIAEYQTTLTMQPNLVKPYQALATIYISRDQYPDAIAALKEALAIKPDLPDAYYGLGKAYVGLGQLAPAAAAYKAAIAARADYPEAYNNLGLVYRRMGDISGAIAAYRSALVIRPDFAAAYNNLGAAYTAQGSYDQAIAAWQNAVRLDANGPTGRAAQANLDIVRTRLGR